MDDNPEIEIEEDEPEKDFSEDLLEKKNNYKEFFEKEFKERKNRFYWDNGIWSC